MARMIIKPEQIPVPSVDGRAQFNVNDDDLILYFDPKTKTWDGEKLNWNEETEDWESEPAPHDELLRTIVRLQLVRMLRIHGVDAPTAVAFIPR